MWLKINKIFNYKTNKLLNNSKKYKKFNWNKSMIKKKYLKFIKKFNKIVKLKIQLTNK